MASGSLGKAYVEVHADMGSFEKEVDKSVLAKMTEVDALMAATGKKGGEKFGENFKADAEKGLKDAEKVIDDVGKTTEHMAEGAAKDAEKLGKDVEQASKKVATGVKGFFQSAWTSIQKLPSMIIDGFQTVTKVVGKFVDTATFGFANVGSTIENLGEDTTSIWSLVGSVAALTGGIVGLVFIAQVLIGAIWGIASAIASLTGLLVLIGPLLASLLTVGILLAPVFKDISAAFTVMTKTGKDYQKALKALDPSIRGFASTLHTIWQSLESLSKKDILKPLLAGFDSLSKALGPTFATMLPFVAKSLGGIITTMSKVFSNPQTAAQIGYIFANLSTVLTIMAKPLADVTASLLSLTANPAVQQFFVDGASAFATVAEGASKWLNAIQSSGALTQFLGMTKGTLTDIKGLLGAIGGFFKTLITPESQKIAHDFLNDVTTLINRITKFLDSKKGQDFLASVDDAMNAGFKILTFLMKTVAEGAAAATSLRHALSGVISTLESLISKAQSAYNWLKKALSVANSFTSLPGIIGGLFHHAEGAIVTAPQVALIGEAGPEVVIPLSKPERARQLAQQSGLTSLLSTNNNSVQVIVSLDGKPFYDYTARALDAAGAELEMARSAA